MTKKRKAAPKEFVPDVLFESREKICREWFRKFKKSDEDEIRTHAAEANS